MPLFDQYKSNYGETVQQSISFSGLQYDFFVTAKTDLLKRLVQGRRTGGRPFTLLDVGCGIGSMHAFLADTFDSICGVDASGESIETARSRYPQNDYRVMEGDRVPCDAASHDVTIAVCVLHHIEIADRHKFVMELKRATRPGGLVCIIEHNPWNPLTRLAVMRCPFDKDARLLGSRQTRGLMQSAGLSGIEACYFLLLPFRSRLSEQLERGLRGLPLGAQYVSIGERPIVDGNDVVV